MSKSLKDQVLCAITQDYELARNEHGQMLLIDRRGGNPRTFLERTKALRQKIREIANTHGATFTDHDLEAVEQQLIAHAHHPKYKVHATFLRVAPNENGIEIDMGDSVHTRIVVGPDKVSTMTSGSTTCFIRSAGMDPFATPAASADLTLLDQYLNMSNVHQLLVKAYLGYTLAHPRVPTTNYLHLVILGEQGSGKTFLCNQVICKLVDPSKWGLQVFPFNKNDLVIAQQNAHLLVYDNLREFSKAWSDILCIASTRGSLSTRQLYTDREELRSELHGPLVLNGIAPFIDQPDLAQRCLTLELLPIRGSSRKTEKQLAAEFQQHLPAIFRGLLELIANIFSHLPTVDVTYPERMIEFVQWLAAMELAMGIPPGDLQALYSDNLRESQHHSVMDSPLGAAVTELIDTAKNHCWHGTPTKLLADLEATADLRTARSPEWPRNVVSMSKRLKALSPALRSQGIEIEFNRGRERTITITQRGTGHE